VDITDTNNLIWEDGMTPEESRNYLESISNAKHLNADQRMQCNMFVGCIEYMESGGSRKDLDELLQKYEVIVPLNAIKLEQKLIDNLKDIATLCKEIDSMTKEADMLRKERDEVRREVCVWKSCPPHTMEEMLEHAAFRGWDCFKENQ
jgi:FtsZ-binding cell division protein ZapB